MADHSSHPSKATSGLQRDMGISIHVQGDVVINMEKLIINNHASTPEDSGETADGHPHARTKDTHGQVADPKTTGDLVDGNATPGLAGALYNDHDATPIGVCRHEEGDDHTSDYLGTSLSSYTFPAARNTDLKFNCRLANCTLSFTSNQQREDHEVWTHFFCGRCGTLHASLDFVERHRKLHDDADHHRKKVKGTCPVAKNDGDD